jgi:hypothetical protein
MTFLSKKSSKAEIPKPSFGSENLIPYQALVPYGDLALAVTRVVSLKNPIGISVLLGCLSIAFIGYYVISPSLLTTFSMVILLLVWLDFGLNWIKKKGATTESLSRDERLKVLYSDYVYAITFMDSIKNSIQKYRDENEYVYIGGATFFLILIAYIGKNLSNVLLFWACTMGAHVGLAYRLDQKLYKIDYNKSKQK